MSRFSDDLLKVSAKLVARRQGQKGPLKDAYVRRSISTTYYAMFHFILDETANRIVGSGNDLRQRRRLFIRTLSHGGLTTAFGKLQGATIDASVVELFRLSRTLPGPIPTPHFLHEIAAAYVDAKAKRENADYDLNVPLSERDARRLGRRVTRAIRAWNAANTKADRDMKHATAILMSLKGQLKS